MDYVTRLLSEVPGLRDASEASLMNLAGRFRVKVHPAGSEICKEGEPADRLFILGDGEVEVIKRDLRGRPYVVATLTPGSLFGHVGVLTLNERTATVRARRECVAAEMSAVALRDLLQTGPFTLTSPLRRALIIALSRQLASATATTFQLAARVGQAVPQPAARPIEDGDMEEAARRLLAAHGQV